MRPNRGHRKQSALPGLPRPGRPHRLAALGPGVTRIECVLDDARGVHCGDAFHVVAQFGRDVIGVFAEQRRTSDLLGEIENLIGLPTVRGLPRSLCCTSTMLRLWRVVDPAL